MRGSEDDIAEARERLIDVLLGEELRARAPVAVADSRNGAPDHAGSLARPRADSGSRRGLLVAAAVVLGVGAVIATAYLKADAGAREAPAFALPRQDPQDPGEVVVRDAAHLRELLQQALGFRMERQAIVGAGRVDATPGAADRLDLVPWPETVTVTRSTSPVMFDVLATELVASTRAERRQNRCGDVFSLVVMLPEDRRLSAFVSVDGDGTYFSVGGLDPFVPTEGLRDALVALGKELVRRREQARGVARSAADLQRLPAESRRVECPAAECGPALDRFTRLRELCLHGEVSAQALEGLAGHAALEVLELDGTALAAPHIGALCRLARLRALTLRHCTGFDRAGVRGLRVLTSLQSLFCIDCAVGGDGGAAEILAELVSLPVLREFGLRDKSLVLTRELLEPLARTKLQRLLLVDVEVRGEVLLALAHLPTLRALELVCSFRDDDLEALREIAGLRRLVVRNASLTQHGVNAFREARPLCEVDWRPDARYFDTSLAFGPVE